MARVVKMLTWTAILTLPGGVLLLPVVIAKRLADRRGLAKQQAAEAPPTDES